MTYLIAMMAFFAGFVTAAALATGSDRKDEQ